MPRKEGREKVTGAARYVDDLRREGMLFGTTVRSPVARGRVRAVHFGDGIPWDEIVVVTARDVPGKNCITLILEDQPCLADGAVNHPEEPVLLLAHADRYLLEEARRAVTPRDRRAAGRLRPRGVARRDHRHLGRGQRLQVVPGREGRRRQRAGRRPTSCVERTYSTGAQEQLYIEPQGVIAEANPHDGVTVWGSLQCPYYVHKALVPLFALPKDKVRVVQTETGGGFGGKEEYPSMIAAHAALLAWKSGKPVKMVYDRAEDMVATTKRHPSRTRIRSAATRDGKLLALDVDFAIDGGAYATLSPVVLSRGTIHAAGPYAVPQRAGAEPRRGHQRAAARRLPRLRRAAEHLRHGVPPRRAARPSSASRPRRSAAATSSAQGDTLAVGQVIKEEVDLPALLDQRLRDDRLPREARALRARATPPRRACARGSASPPSCTAPGSRDRARSTSPRSSASTPPPTESVRVRVASTEIGQGTNTILAQIAAEALALPYDQVEVAQPDTANVPNSGPTVASRTTMVVGKLVESAALALRAKLVEHGLLAAAAAGGYSADDFRAACARYHERFGPLQAVTQYHPPPGIRWDDETYQGDAYGAYAWAVYVAEVSVDTLTSETTVDDFVAVQEVGRVIHPVLAAGQIEGGVAQGIGWALYENVVWERGRMVNAQMTNYIIPTAADVPPIRVAFTERPYAGGPGGAKGIGELPMDGPAPAIVNAIAHATGVRVRHVPLTPEALMAALDEAAGAEETAALVAG